MAAEVAGRHRKVIAARSWKLRIMLLLAAAFATLLGLVLSGSNSAPAHASSLPKRVAAFDWAKTQAGKPYEWGGTGPYGYDCSGLVYAAYRHVGITLPRDTEEMLAAIGSGKLWVTTDPKPGDLAFYGSGHVEMVTHLRHTTFGALHSGAPVWWHKWSYSWGWFPTIYLAVSGAG